MRAEDRLIPKLLARSARKSASGNGHQKKKVGIRIEWQPPVGRQRAHFRLIVPKNTDALTRERALVQFRSFVAWYRNDERRDSECRP